MKILLNQIQQILHLLNQGKAKRSKIYTKKRKTKTWDPKKTIRCLRSISLVSNCSWLGEEEGVLKRSQFEERVLRLMRLTPFTFAIALTETLCALSRVLLEKSRDAGRGEKSWVVAMASMRGALELGVIQCLCCSCYLVRFYCFGFKYSDWIPYGLKMFVYFTNRKFWTV